MTILLARFSGESNWPRSGVRQAGWRRGGRGEGGTPARGSLHRRRRHGAETLDLLDERTRRRRQPELLAMHKRGFHEMAAGDAEGHGEVKIFLATTRLISTSFFQSPKEVLAVITSGRRYRREWRKTLMVRLRQRSQRQLHDLSSIAA